MLFGLSFPLTGTLGYLIDLGRRAEKAGFGYLWMPDHILSLNGKEPLNAWSVLTILATQTRQVYLGTGVTNIYKQHPIVLYHHASTLNRISGGRAVLGIGVGSSFDTLPFGIQRKNPLVRLKETIETVKSRIDVPVYVGTSSPKIRRLTGKLADGWLPYVHTLPEYRKEVRELRAYVGSRPFDYVANVPVSFTDTPRIWRSLAYRFLLKAGVSVGHKNIPPDLVPRKVLEGISAVGSKTKIIRILEQYVNVGATQLLIRLYDDSFEKFRGVIQHFRD